MKVSASFLGNNATQKADEQKPSLSRPVREHEQINELRAFHTPKINFKGLCPEFKELPPELKEAMDKVEADFEIPTGYYGIDKIPFHGTVKEYLEACFTDEAQEVTKKNLLHATTKEKAQSIYKTGFDLNRCARDLGGPGIYLTHDAAYALQVANGTEVISADFKGVSRSINSHYYRSIHANEGLDEKLQGAIDGLGLDISLREAKEKYVLQAFRDDFGLDAVYSNCQVVVRPEKLTGMGRSSVSDMKLTGSGYDAYFTSPSHNPSSGTNSSHSSNNNTRREETPEEIKYRHMRY